MPTDLEHVFSYHAPTTGQDLKYQIIREAAKDLVKAIEMNAPACADTSAAVRKVREAVMTANAAIALEGRL